MRHVWQTRNGSPEDTLEVRDFTPGPLAEARVRVQIDAAPILPMDHLLLQGLYPLPGPLPGVPGAVGVGRVIDGPSAWLNAQVVLPLRTGAWATHVDSDTAGLIRLDPAADAVTASLLRVNGLTAQAMLEGLSRGDTVLFNAGTGGVSHVVMHLARRQGVRTVAVVRSACELPADHVLVDDEQLPEQFRALALGPVHRAFDGVGGTSTERLGQCLANGGRVLHYGAMSGHGPRLRTLDSIFRGVLLQGFWLDRLDEARGRDATAHILNRLVELDLPARRTVTLPLDSVLAGLQTSKSAAQQVVLTPNLLDHVDD